MVVKDSQACRFGSNTSYYLDVFLNRVLMLFQYMDDMLAVHSASLCEDCFGLHMKWQVMQTLPGLQMTDKKINQCYDSKYDFIINFEINIWKSLINYVILRINQSRNIFKTVYFLFKKIFLQESKESSTSY